MPIRTAIFAAAIALSAPATAEILGPDAAACQPGSNATAVLLTVEGLKNRDGNIRVELWPGNQRDFLRDHHELQAEGKAYQRVTVDTPRSGPVRICIRLPEPGTYALGVFHSPTGERKFSVRNDGVTFTRNPRMGLRQPRANEVAVRYSAGVHQEEVTLNYMRGLAFQPLPKNQLQAAEQQQH